MSVTDKAGVTVATGRSYNELYDMTFNVRQRSDPASSTSPLDGALQWQSKSP